MLRIEVSDTGPGIPYDLQPKLFSKFVQGDGSNTRRHGGTGLGLAISKGLAEAMGGAVGMLSHPGLGATFWAEIPVERAAAGDPASTSDAPVRPFAAVSPLRVLVADDNVINQTLAVRLLQKRGLLADVAANGAVAVAKCSEYKYDLILMDCQMPELDGYSATERIRRGASEAASTPIIAMTAHVSLEERERTAACGMNDFLAKPFRTEELDAILTRWLPLGSQNANPEPQPDLTFDA